MNNLRQSTKTPSRRDLLSGRFSPDTSHIASLMVQAWPDHLSEVTPLLNAIPGVEVHASEANGRMVVTVESDSDARLLDAISSIERTEHVVTASLVYHQIED